MLADDFGDPQTNMWLALKCIEHRNNKPILLKHERGYGMWMWHFDLFLIDVQVKNKKGGCMFFSWSGEQAAGWSDEGVFMSPLWQTPTFYLLCLYKEMGGGGAVTVKMLNQNVILAWGMCNALDKYSFVLYFFTFCVGILWIPCFKWKTCIYGWESCHSLEITLTETKKQLRTKKGTEKKHRFEWNLI